MKQKIKTGFYWAALGVLLYALYATFPIGMLRNTAEAENGVDIAKIASDPAHKNADAVVVELFTSQGCYSCPPAEAYLRDLAGRPDVIALEHHVDYWDDLVYGAAGRWKDPFSSPEATMRQSFYNRAIRQKDAIYTPQMVIGGRFEAVGSRERQVEAAIAEAKALPTKSIKAVLGTDQNLTVDLPASAQAGTNADVILVRLLKRKVTKVTSGENKGKTLASYNIVQKTQKIGTWNGSAQQLKWPVQDIAADQSCAVLIQNKTNMHIYGAGFCEAS